MTYDEACGLIAELMNQWFAVDPERRTFTAESVARELAGDREAASLGVNPLPEEWAGVLSDSAPLRSQYPSLAMELLMRADVIDDAFSRTLIAIDQVAARLSALTEEDRRAGWTEEVAARWVEILRETRTDLARGDANPQDLRIVGVVARWLDYDGLSNGSLADALYSITNEIGMLPNRSGSRPGSDSGRTQKGSKGA